MASRPSARTRRTPSGSRAATCRRWPGYLVLTDGQVTLRVEPGVGLKADGTVVEVEQPLADDLGGQPTIVDLGSLRFHVIRRGDRVGLRVRDTEASVLREFPGVPRFPVDPAWRVTGHLERAPGIRTVDVPDVLGDVRAEESPGVVHFDLGGEHLHLDALQEDEDRLWLIFGDTTNGHRDLLRRPLPGDRARGGGRIGRDRLQPRLQPALRVQPVRHLPPAVAGQPAFRRGPGRGAAAGIGSYGFRPPGRRTRLPDR